MNTIRANPSFFTIGTTVYLVARRHENGREQVTRPAHLNSDEVLRLGTQFRRLVAENAKLKRTESAMETLPIDSLPPNARYWAYLREGRFMLQRSRTTGKFVFYPRLLCPVSGRDDLEFTEIDGRGTVHSTTVVRRKASSGGDYNVALVDLDVGVRVPGRVLGVTPSDVKIGMRVRSSIEGVDFGTYANSTQPIVIFRPE